MNKKEIFMDIKKEVNKIIDKIKNDKDFASKFKKEPIKAVEGVIGIDLPDKEIEKVVTAVKTKLKLDESGITDKIMGLFK